MTFQKINYYLVQFMSLNQLGIKFDLFVFLIYRWPLPSIYAIYITQKLLTSSLVQK